MTDDVELRRLAIRRADQKLAFRSHLFAYVLVNAGLVGINLITSPDYWWFVWPMLGWGLGLLAHGVTVYVDGESMRDRLIEQELEKLRKSSL
jgi:hypothetical protein